VFIILQIIKNKANHHPTRHHAENCINIRVGPHLLNENLNLYMRVSVRILND